MTETRGMTAEEPWWQDRENLALLLQWMASADSEGSWNMSDAAYAVEKPWKYADEYAKAKAWAKRENAGTG